MAAIDIDTLLAAISEDAPSGENMEYDSAFIALEQKARGTPERQIGDLIEPAQPPNWREIRSDSLDLLRKTRDLRLLVELTRASLALDGLAGFRDSLSLLQSSLETYWDSIHPQLDPDDDYDPTLRINILMGLCDQDSTLRMLLKAPLVESKAAGRFCLRDIHIASGKLPSAGGEEAPQADTIQIAFSDADAASLQASHDALTGSLDGLGAIERGIAVQIGADRGPNFDPLRNLLKEALHVIDQNMARRGLLGDQVREFAEETPQPGAAGTVSGSAQGIPLAVNTRQDVIRLLDLICEYYARFEPSSPVPLLARRAKRLVPMDFMEIMRDLAPDGLAQVEIVKGHDSGDDEE